MNAAHIITPPTRCIPPLVLHRPPLSSMGGQAKKKRDAARAAEWKSKKESAKPFGSTSATSTNDHTPKMPKPASLAPVEGPVQCSTCTHSASTPISSGPIAVVVPTPPVPPVQEAAAPCSCCSTSASAQDQLVHQLQAEISKEDEPGDSDNEELGVDDLEHIVVNQGPESDPDIEIGTVQFSGGQLGIIAPKPTPAMAPAKSHMTKGPKKRQVIQGLSESDDDEMGELLDLDSFTILTLCQL